MHKTIRIAVVDDETVHRGAMEALARRYGKARGVDVRLELYENGFQFLSQYDAAFDAVFLDILMPHMDGMETARRLRKLDEDVPLIFATTVAQYALQGYEVGAMGYMLKPVSYEEFEIKLDKIRRSTTARAQQTYPITQGGKLQMIPVRTIRYVEVSNHSLVFHGEGQVFTVGGQLNALEQDPRFAGFTKSSASHLVNCSWVTEVDSDSVRVDGEAVPLSRRRRKGFLQEMARILGGTY